MSLVNKLFEDTFKKNYYSETEDIQQNVSQLKMEDILKNQLKAYQAEYDYLLQQEEDGNLKNADKKLFAVEEKIRLVKEKLSNLHESN